MSQQSLVGFGFGPIQSGLFLYEAFVSGRFSRLTVGEVDRSLVAAVRGNGGKYQLNIALPDGIQVATVSGVELWDLTNPTERQAMLKALAESGVWSTALPSVAFYDRGGENSVAALMAAALQQRTTPQPTIIYTAENHNHAAEILQQTLQQKTPASHLQLVQPLNTVIGKMSGVVTEPSEIARLKLAPIAPGISKAILVEAFNKILITQIAIPGHPEACDLGIPAFIQKTDLLPFEEAKLYGHNAIHSLIGYLSWQRGLQTMDQAAQFPEIMTIARAAFLEESGGALCKKYAALQDPLFTQSGYQAYVDDLLKRMVNPHLSDPVARVIRDPQRKLSWEDRLFGTMRLVWGQGISPKYLAHGAAAGLKYYHQETGKAISSKEALASVLQELWQTPELTPEMRALFDLTWAALATRE